MAKVTLERVRKIYEERGTTHVAVHGIDLEIPDGEFLVLVGPSGCGKSTTLRMVAGLESVTEGTIRIGERVVNEVSARDRDIAMVFQNYALYPHMTVAENLGFALKLRKQPRAVIDARVREAAGMLGIESMLERRPRQLSGGQRQRVALGRAIVRQPQVFLFDEPLSNLDAKLRVQMRRELAALRRRLGTTTIYVTHDQVEAMTLGDRIVLMHEGKVQQVGAPLDIYQRPANLFVAGFLGSPHMNQIAGRVERRDGARFEAADGSLRIRLRETEVPATAEGRAVVLGIRPEAIQPGSGPEALSGVVEEIEPLGHESLLTVRAGSTPITLRTEAGLEAEVGETLQLVLLPGALHWFDAASGLRLG
ncbi:MAG TPA: sn-glycerol-3-phosphate ABC transporter ATP-binding protein UgpC [Gemmatimonadales bacterium]|nr:sn-glycerol-3-phosphate ABC transporter ATP-binding protein UgpC [Gemmatimonadales bacterium]